MVMSSQTKDLICAMLTIPLAEKMLESLKTDKEIDKGYSQIIKAYFTLRAEFERTYDKS